MHFFTPSECVTWCVQRGYPAGLREGYTIPGADKEPSGFYVTKFSIPNDSGAKVAFARFLYSLINPAPHILLWLDEWAVWPSSAHMPLFMRFREALGERRILIEAPGQLAEPADAEDAISTVVVALEFIWDCHIIAASGREAVFFSHDEYGWYGSRDEPQAEFIRKKLIDWDKDVVR